MHPSCFKFVVSIIPEEVVLHRSRKAPDDDRCIRKLASEISARRYIRFESREGEPVQLAKPLREQAVVLLHTVV